MLKRIGERLSRPVRRLRRGLSRRRLAVFLAALVGLAAIAGGAYYLVTELFDSEEPEPAPAPPAVVREVEVEEAETEDLGFPAFATKNTTRVAGPDPIADAAGVALAVFPSIAEVPGAAAVSLVEADDWPAGIAAASLVAAPIGAPILLTEDGEVPELTEEALRTLAPRGSGATDRKQAFRIGAAAEAGDLRTRAVEGETPAEIAAEVARLRASLARSEPEHLVVVSSDDPAFAMPAAAWAARSGDPVLFVERRSAPKPTLEALRRYEDVPVFVLGPESAISKRAFEQVREVAPGVERIAAPDPVRSAVEFARHASGSFGWNINDPGHGFVIANAERPADAAAAAPLSASGTWGPLLVTDDADAPPPALRSYLLDLKPGYQQDPTRALYNHVWLIGDREAISVAFQAQVDELAELAKVRPGRGESLLGPAPGTPEAEAPDQGARSGQGPRGG